MADKWTNPNPNFHIDALKGQYRIFSLVHKRMMQEVEDGKVSRLEEAKQLGEELQHLYHLIHSKLGVNTNV